MANRCPHFPQTTVSIVIALEDSFGNLFRRIATPFGFTSAALDVDVVPDGRLARHHGSRRSAEFAAWLR